MNAIARECVFNVALRSSDYDLIWSDCSLLLLFPSHTFFITIFFLYALKTSSLFSLFERYHCIFHERMRSRSKIVFVFMYFGREEPVRSLQCLCAMNKQNSPLTSLIAEHHSSGLQ